MSKLNQIFAYLALLVVGLLPISALAHPVPGELVHFHDGFDFRTLVWFAVVLAVIVVFPLLARKKAGEVKVSARRRQR